MRSTLLVIIFCLFCTIVGRSQSESECNLEYSVVPLWYIEPCNTNEHGDWTLVFEDDFEDESINTSNWYTYPDGWQRHHGNELQYYLDDNIVLSDGLLKLTAKREPGYYPCYDIDAAGNFYSHQEYFEYTSGWIQTKANFQYGLFEIRCKIPKGKGFWPAFWFYGNGREIDVFEFRGDKPHRPQTDIHVWCDDGGHEHFSEWHNLIDDFSDDFHTFSLEWDEHRLRFYVDGILIRTECFYYSIIGDCIADLSNLASGYYLKSPFFPNPSQHIIINLAISQDGGGIHSASAPDATTVFPSSFDIDYIRVYKKNNPNVNRSLCQVDLETDPSVTTADNIVLGGCEGDSIIKNNQVSINIANEAIILSDGFYAAPGSVFIAKINNDATRSVVANIDMDNTYENEEENENEKSVMSSSEIVYPNPNDGSFNVILPLDENEHYVVEIINIEGKRVYFKDNVVSNEIVLNTNLKKGLYILKASNEKQSFVNKIVINR